MGTRLCQPVPRGSRSFPCPAHPPPGSSRLVTPHRQARSSCTSLESLPILRFSFSHRSLPRAPSSRLECPPVPRVSPTPLCPVHPGPSQGSPLPRTSWFCPGPWCGRGSPRPPCPVPPMSPRVSPHLCRLPQPPAAGSCSPALGPRPRTLPLAEPLPSSSSIGCRSGHLPRAPPLRFLQRLPSSAAPQALERLVEGEHWRACTSIIRHIANEKAERGVGGHGCHIRAWRAVARRRERCRALPQDLISSHLIYGHFHGKSPLSLHTEFPSPIRGLSGKTSFIFGLK